MASSPATDRGWWRIGAGCLAVVALIVQAFREAVQSRPR